MGFTFAANPARVVFGRGTLDTLADEVRRLGRTRVVLVSDGGLTETVARAADRLGPLLVARFNRAIMHTPVEVTTQALDVVRETGADCVVSIGGGSTTGLGKAISVGTGIPQIAVPTTYAGSEVTPVLGETADGTKTTRSAPEIRPETVIYDIDLTLGLPPGLSVTSGVNAIAHAVEALYAPDANPLIDSAAVESVTRLARALPRIVADPADFGGRKDALIGAWLAGTCLGAVGMGLHHKLCHTLGGSFGLPHAETHTVVLPHAMAYNEKAAPEAMRTVAAALHATDAPAAMYDLIVSLGGPTTLQQLGLGERDVAQAAALATTTPYPNPAPVNEAGLVGLLVDAWRGTRPDGVPGFRWLTDEVEASFAGTPDPRVHRLVTDLVRRLHRFVNDNDVTESEWMYGIEFLTRTGQISDAKRQEFVLLSDTLGVSSMVDLLTNSRTPETTPSAVLGPFYTPGPPEIPAGGDIADGMPGTPLWADVLIADPDGTPIVGAVVDVWQSNDDGFYDIQLPDLDGPVLRGRLRSDADGRVTFWSILPSEYPIPADGPVGAMLAGTGRHPYRAPHLHFMISAPNRHRLITQLFVAGGAYLDSDTVFGVKDPLIVDFVPGVGAPPDGRDIAEWRWLTYTFHIAQEQQ
jgi:maleylacetate reductase